MTKKENEERIAKLKNIVLSMPEKPGSYQYYDENHTIIYVGKAKDVFLLIFTRKWIDTRQKCSYLRFTTFPIQW